MVRAQRSIRSDRWLNLTATVDDFIDVIMKDHRKYIKWYVVRL